MIIPKNLQVMLTVTKKWSSFSLLIGVQTASLSIPLCLILRLPIQI